MENPSPILDHLLVGLNGRWVGPLPDYLEVGKRSGKGGWLFWKGKSEPLEGMENGLYF